LNKKKKCSVCGFATISSDYSSYDICEICGWEDEAYQNEHPDETGFANGLSLNQYRKKWLKEHHRAD
jgi:rubredoxin